MRIDLEQHAELCGVPHGLFQKFQNAGRLGLRRFHQEFIVNLEHNLGVELFRRERRTSAA